jgi:HAD superfamily hydrolase (TIGR01509 family)
MDHVFYQCIGLRRADSRLVLERGLGHLVDLAEFDTSWETRIESRLADNVPVKPGAENLLQQLQDRGIPRVVATSTTSDVAIENLKTAGLYPLITTVLGGEQVENGKPDPEIYLKAAALAGHEPGDCAAFEDSDPGTLAAVRSGALTVQVPDLRPPSAQTLALGHVVADDLYAGALRIGLIAV